MKLLSDLHRHRAHLALLVVFTLPMVSMDRCFAAQEVELGGPSTTNQVDLSIQADTLTIRTTGHDPYLVWDLPEGLSKNTRVLEFEYFCLEKIDAVSGLLGPPWAERSRFDLPELSIAQGWQVYAVDLLEAAKRVETESATKLRIDCGMRSNARIKIRRMRLRGRTAKEARESALAEMRRQQKISQSLSIANYLGSSFPLEFDRVAIDLDSISVEGRLPSDNVKPRAWQLVEYPPHESIDGPGIPCEAPIQFSSDRFQVILPRATDNRDRVHSAWRIRESDALNAPFLSARHYANVIKPVEGEFATVRPRPASQKGLSGMSTRGPIEELPELGIHAITINLVLSRFLSDRAGEGREKLDVSGPPIYFDSRAFRPYDKLIGFAHRHEIVVSAIVLIPRPRNRAPGPLVHPEANGGVYSMPDLTSERGANLYGQVLDRIARRYRNTNQDPGGITNWIAHNEVDFHSVWTNMGQQPPEVFLEAYYRSMRMIYGAARSYNPHARVFASLTHHWVVSVEGSWKRLAPRSILEQLQRYCQLEGDFAWGVAYHPYPQSLFAAVAWKDTKIRDDFDTPLITIQNLEVLGRFLEQPEMRDAEGEMRPVLLSEQGFHTDSYEEQAQARQAASLWYAMKKVRSMPWIESFHYHRWIDHPDEGGLKVGLRTLPTQDHPHGKRKRAWKLYQAFGTDKETEVARGLPQP